MTSIDRGLTVRIYDSRPNVIKPPASVPFSIDRRLDSFIVGHILFYDFIFSSELSLYHTGSSHLL
jgi:hypothetical protein